MSDTVSALDLYWLADRMPDLLEARLKGTARPWRQAAQWDPAARHAADEAARVERAERSDAAIGEHPAPLHLDTFDLLVDVLATADTLAAEIAQAAGVDALGSATSSYADPEPFLRFAARWLHQAAEVNEHVGRHAQLEAARLRSEVAVALGEVTDGQTLQALCPWCGGLTATAPAGGAFTLRVRTLPGGTVAVVCHGACEPPEADCGTWWKGHPAWPLDTEGEWLALRIGAAHEEVA